MTYVTQYFVTWHSQHPFSYSFGMFPLNSSSYHLFLFCPLFHASLPYNFLPNIYFTFLIQYSSKQTLTKCPINLSNVAQGLGCIAVSTVENEAFPNCTLNPLFIFRVYFSILWISTDFNLPGSAVCGNMLGLWSRKIWVWIPALWSFWK